MAEDLFKAAKAAMANAYVRYSDFPVGSAIRTASGNIYAGCNIENSSYPEGWCAETSAISHMVTAGERDIAEILVVAEKLVRATPCGGCRQRISEFAGPDTLLHLCDENGVVDTIPFRAMLPAGFNLDDVE